MSKQSIIRENLMVNLALLSLLWLSLLYFGTPAATIGLDASWTQSFAYAFKNGYQAGVDYIYTYGPLGYFYHSLSSYDADLFYSFMAWRIIMGLLIAAFFVAIASKIDGKIEKFLYFFLLTVVISSFPTDPLHFLVITGVVILAIKTLPSFKKNPGRSAILIGVILCFLAVLSLTKFTHFVLVSLGIFAITVMVWHLYSVLVALAIPLTFAIFIMIVWLIIGQSPSNFPDFIANSLQIASGYGEAMSILFTPTEIKLAMACFGIMTPLVLLACFIKPLKFERFVIAGFIMLGLFLAWKAGFIRQGLHERIFFAFAVIVPLFLDYNRDMNVMLLFVYKALRYLAIFTALAGLFVVVGTSLNYKPHNFIGKWNKRVVNNFHTLLHLQQHKENNEKIVVNFKLQYDLPNIRESVGQSTVDIFSWEQGVLFLNELNWHPRPVFQSYTAYTPSLIATNGDFYASDKAPEFVIFKLQAVDWQFPLMNDAEAIKIVLRDYQPLLSEKGYLLLKRKPRGQGFVSKGETLLTRQI